MNKQFREDLYYRLNVVQIEAPPLRQRGDDIQLLAEYYFDYFNRHYRKSLSGFSDEAMAWLMQHDYPGNVRELKNIMMQHEYPGNVRELKNIIERAIIMERGDRITLASFPKMSAVPSGVASSKSAGLRDLEREHIVAMHGGWASREKHCGKNCSGIISLKYKLLQEYKSGVAFSAIIAFFSFQRDYSPRKAAQNRRRCSSPCLSHLFHSMAKCIIPLPARSTTIAIHVLLWHQKHRW